ncbi:hypothetical protein RIF29_04288 [Crotalaria pallida]|uniref:Myb/SANT-like domain-containing protein n=1 Tax=Crotalaria pallida TaxID=3830 RepID=A0AAN9P975_CROPI
MCQMPTANARAFYGPRMSAPISKATWTPEFHKIFIDLCVEETLKGNKPGTHFTKEGWANLLKSFYAKAGVRYDKIQVKNHYDLTRKQWKIWVKLIDDSTMKWNPETNKFGASVEDWHNYIKANPEAAQFQFKEIQFKDKLDIIFGGEIQKGETKTVIRLKRHNDASATSPLYGKEQEKKRPRISDEETLGEQPTPTTVYVRSRRKGVGRDCELNNAIVVNAVPINMISSEQSISSSPPPVIKAKWTPLVHKIFVDICLQETVKGNKPGKHFTKEGWKNIMDSFYLKTGLNYDRLQLKNHWDLMKGQWKIWCKLIGTSYMKWDPSNQKFEATEEDWAKYLKSNPDAAQFRLKELQFTDILETIFNGTSTTVTEEIEPAKQQRKSDDSDVTFPLHKKEANTTKLEEKSNCLCDAVASRNVVPILKNAAAISSIEGKRNYSIGECIECLDSMEEIEQGSDLYLFALDVFLKQEYREIFLQLKRPNLRVSWLQRLQSAGPPSL